MLALATSRYFGATECITLTSIGNANDLRVAACAFATCIKFACVGIFPKSENRASKTRLAMAVPTVLPENQCKNLNASARTFFSEVEMYYTAIDKSQVTVCVPSRIG